MSEYTVPGKSTAESILEGYEAWKALEDGAETASYDGEEFTDSDELIERIQDEPLSVLVNYGWCQPGQARKEGPEEYEILLSTGGPAVRIWGKLNEHNTPETAVIQGQDWFKPWERVATSEAENEAILWYASNFYYDD